MEKMDMFAQETPRILKWEEVSQEGQSPELYVITQLVADGRIVAQIWEHEDGKLSMTFFGLDEVGNGVEYDGMRYDELILLAETLLEKEGSPDVGDNVGGTTVKPTDLEKSVALKWFKAQEAHECSWDVENKKYTSESSDDLFLNSLTEEEKQTAISMFIVAFSHYSNDIIMLLENVLGYKYEWKELKAKERELKESNF